MKPEIRYKIKGSGFNRFFAKAILFILLTIFIVACQESLEYNYPQTYTSYLMVEGKITTDTTKHFVILSRSISLSDTALVWVSDADVKISGNSKIVNLVEETPGHYYTDSDYYGIIGNSYTLNITLATGDEYEATTQIRDVPEIDSVKILWENWSGYGDYSHFIYYHGWELEEEENAYLWNLYLDDTLYNDTIWNTSFVDDELVNGSYIGIGNKRYFDSLNNRYDIIGSNFAIYDLDPDEIDRERYEVLVEMESIPIEYYDFWVQFMSQTVWVGSPFDAPKANPVNNISNNALGYFYGASVKRYSFTYKPPEWSIGYENPNY
jgi:hypothetical protein